MGSEMTIPEMEQLVADFRLRLWDLLRSYCSSCKANGSGEFSGPCSEHAWILVKPTEISKSLTQSVLDLREENAHLRQRLEWVAAAFHGDALYGSAWDDRLFVDVMQLRNQHDRLQSILEQIYEAANINDLQANRLGAVLKVLTDYNVQSLPTFEEWAKKNSERKAP